MSTSVHLRRFRGPVLSVLLCGVLASASLAIPMKVTVGFDGAAKSFFWTPVAVELSNTSDDDIEGVVSVLQPESGMPYLASCSARVSMPAHSKKLYHSYARLASYGEVTVLFSRGNAVYAIRKLPVDAVSKSDALVVSVGARSTRLNFLNGDTITRSQRYSSQQGGSPGPAQGAIHVGSIHQSNLPDRPSAYEGVDLLILSDLTPASVNPKALKAIAMWVASGGTLVVPTGPNYRNFQNEFYDDLLPVKIVGAANLPGMPSLSPLGRTPFPAGAVSVSKSVLKPGVGRALASESGVPLIAERDYGAGRVLFFAFDHLSSPFKDWNGQSECWKGVLMTPPPEPMALSTVSMLDESDFQNQYRGNPYQAQQPAGMVGLVVRNPAVKAPSFNSIGLFLIAYLVALAPVNYFVLKRRKRLELAWVTTPAIVLLFTVGAYAIGYTMKGSDLRLRQATMIEATSDSRYAAAVTNASLFSPARRNYDLEADDPYALSQAIPVKANEELPSGYLDEKCTLENIAMAMWSSRAFESVSGVDLGGAIKSDLTLTGRQITGQVRNDTQVPLTDCVVYYAGRNVKIPDLPKGGTAKVDIFYTGKAFGLPLSHVGPRQPDDLVAGLYDYAGTQAIAAGNPVLVARPAVSSGAFSLVGRRVSTSGSVCCVFRLGYETSGVFSVAPSSISTSIMRSDGVNADSPNARTGAVNLRMWGGRAVCVVSFRISMPAGSRATSLLLTAQGSGPDGMRNLEVSAWNWKTGHWAAVNVLSGGVALDPASHLTEPGETRIRVRCTGGSQRVVTLGITAAGTRL